MAGVPRPQFLRLGREPEECIDLSFGEKRQRLDGRARDPVDVLHRVEPDLRRHQGQEILGAQLEADALALQLRYPVDVFLSEELKAAGMQTGEHGHWYAGIERLELLDRETRDEIDLTAPDRIVGSEPFDRFDVSDVGKSLGAQQFFGNVYGSTADRGNPGQTDR